MKRVVLGVIINDGRIAVEQLSEEVRVEFRGVPAVLPGGNIKEGETPEEATKRKVYKDLGIDVHVEHQISSREHPLFPGSSVTYFFCTVIGDPALQNRNTNKSKSVEWVDINTAIVLMLTLYSQVLAFMLRKVFGSTLPQGSSLPEIEWLVQDLPRLGAKIREGELVAFPTETVYGIGANAFNAEAVANIFKVKNRPADNPLIVHVSSLEAIEQVTSSISLLSSRLLSRFMPGPITVLLPKGENIPLIVTAGSPYVGVRIPSHGLALEFLAAANVPIAAPSANKSGKPSATHHEHVFESFGKELPNVLRAGRTTFGLESTVVLPKNGEQLVIMRQGAISKEDLQKAFPKNEVIIASKQDAQHVPTPGSKYRHYAPSAKIELLPLVAEKKLIAIIKKSYRSAIVEGESVAVLCSLELQQKLPNSIVVVTLGSEKDLNDIGANLYKAMIECDARRITKIFMQSFPEEGIGRTVMERIRRAAEPS